MLFDVPGISMSHSDVVVIQWITACHKKMSDHTCNNTLARTRNVIDKVHIKNAFSY